MIDNERLEENQGQLLTGPSSQPQQLLSGSKERHLHQLWANLIPAQGQQSICWEYANNYNIQF